MNSTPARRRSVATASKTKAPSLALIQLAAATYATNAVKNKAEGDYKKNRKSLYAKMKEEGFTSCQVDAVIGTKSVALDVVVDAPKREVIDVSLLRKFVSDEVFLKIVTASKAAVEEHAGGAVVAQCVAEKEGEENVSVKAVK